MVERPDKFKSGLVFYALSFDAAVSIPFSDISWLRLLFPYDDAIVHLV